MKSSQKYLLRKLIGSSYPSRKKQKKECDLLWAKLIKLRAKGRCEYCGGEGKNAHHIYSRNRASTRHDPANGIFLCPLHHTLGVWSFHKNPIESVEWLKKKKGEKWYQMLRIRAEQIYKPDYNLIKLDLLQELKKHE